MPPEPLPQAPSLRSELRRYWDKLGPGWITGAADDDPSGVATYSQAGARYGLQLIWVTLLSYPLMVTVQEMCARIGLASGRGLAANIKRQYPASASYAVAFLLFIANTINIAANLGAMAAATRLLVPAVPALWLVFLFALVSIVLQVVVPYGQYVKYLKYLTFVLFAYVAAALMVGLDWGEVLRHTVKPSITFSRDQLILLCAILGTTISPYLFFWQTAQEVEEEILHGDTSVVARKKHLTPEMVRSMRIDVWSGMALSNAVAFFIIAAAAGALYANGVTDIVTAEQAALALKPFGPLAFVLFALGIVGTGMIAMPVLAGSAAYALAESFGWRFGLYRTLRKARAFYGVIVLAVVIGGVASVTRLDPIRGLVYAAVINGIIAPVVLFFIVRLSSNKHVMGPYVNSRLSTSVGWVTVVVMALAGIAALLAMFS